MLIKSGGLIASVGNGNGVKKREETKVSLREEKCPVGILLENNYLIINGFQEEPNTF